MCTIVAIQIKKEVHDDKKYIFSCVVGFNLFRNKVLNNIIKSGALKLNLSADSQRSENNSPRILFAPTVHVFADHIDYNHFSERVVLT